MPTTEILPKNRQRAYAILRDNGLPVKEAATAVGYSVGSESHLYRSVEKKRKSFAEGLGNLAKKAVKLTLQGQPVGEAAPPKASDVLHAAEIVADRIDPKVARSESKSLQVTLDITPQQAQELDSIMSGYYTKMAKSNE